MGKAPCCDKDNVKRGAWSPEEDETLKTYIHQHGTGGNWITLPKKAGLRRCGKSCRLRWLNYLRPDLKHGGFTEEEDIIIYTLYSQIGSRWSFIASQLHGRTDNDVKNHWNTKLKKKLLGTKSKNKEHKFMNPNFLGSTTLTIENCVNQDFHATPPISANVNHHELNLTTQKFFHDGTLFGPSPIFTNLPQFDENVIQIQETSSASASSSFVSLDDKYVQWSMHGGGEDNCAFTDMGFGFSNEFLSFKDVPSTFVSSLGNESMFYDDIKPHQGLLESVINSREPY